MITTETQQSPTTPPQPEPITRAALDALIAAQGHELRLVRTIIDVDAAPGVRLSSYNTYRACTTCGASVDEDAEGMDVDARLLAACQEPTWISYQWEGDENDESAVGL
jgi:hypothetical protein